MNKLFRGVPRFVRQRANTQVVYCMAIEARLAIWTYRLMMTTLERGQNKVVAQGISTRDRGRWELLSKVVLLAHCLLLHCCLGASCNHLGMLCPRQSSWVGGGLAVSLFGRYGSFKFSIYCLPCQQGLQTGRPPGPLEGALEGSVGGPLEGVREGGRPLSWRGPWWPCVPGGV